MSQDGQTHFGQKSICCKIFKVCLTILGHYALKGLKKLIGDLMISGEIEIN